MAKGEAAVKRGQLDSIERRKRGSANCTARGERGILTWSPSASVTPTPGDLGLHRGDAAAAGSACTGDAGAAVDLGLRRSENAGAAGAAALGGAVAANILRIKYYKAVLN